MDNPTKKFDWKQLAPIGLGLGGLGLLAAAGLFIVFQVFNLYVQIGLAVAVIGLALYALLDPEAVRLRLTGRQMRYGSNSLILTIAIVGIVVVVNYLGNTYTRRWDLTEDKTNTLAKETIATLQSLKQPVSAQAFFTAARSTDSAKAMLDNYKRNSNGKFDYKFINPNNDPVAAQAAKITQDGSIVLIMGSSQEIVTDSSEASMTAGLVHLINPGKRGIYFLTGHGEHDAFGSAQLDYANARALLESKNYTVKTLNLLTDPAIPTDALSIIIAGPKQALNDKEMALIEGYLAKGGSLVVLSDPPIMTDIGTNPDPLAKYLASNWKITLGSDLIIDQTSTQLTVAVGSTTGTHAITKGLSTTAFVMPQARSVQIAGGTTALGADNNPVKLVTTSNNSWAETDMAALKNNQTQFDQGADTRGPITLAASAESNTVSTRVVVFGNSSFASDALISQYGNTDLFVNAIDWATGQEAQINLTPKANTQRVLVPPQQYAVGLILLVSVFAMPALIILAGVLVWLQRRRRG